MSAGATVFTFVLALVAGAFGSVLGIGGGLFVVPGLTLFLGVPLKTAIAASIVAVIATSLSGGNIYVRAHLADVRLGLALALATAPGGIAGALLASHVSARLLAGLFAAILSASLYQMLAGGRTRREAVVPPAGDDGSRLRFRSGYVEPSTGNFTPYTVRRVPLGVAVSVVAGLIAGLLGVGGGIVQVPVMNGLMGVPLKVATTTSTYIIGITAMAGAFVYYSHRPSFVDPALAVPTTIGIFIGASAGSALLSRLDQRLLRLTFTAVLGVAIVQMVLRIFGLAGG